MTAAAAPTPTTPTTPTTAASAAEQAERAVTFECQGERLLGVLHPGPGDVGVVVIVGGPQYRAGSHRLFVQLARTLAAQGHPVLRFDVRGMGDSAGNQRGFEDLDDDIAAAVSELLRLQPQVDRVVLWGLCDGASAALLYLDRCGDPRVAGLALLNPWVRSEATLARTQVKHYYGQRLLQPTFWTKLLRGGIGVRALKEFVASLVKGLGRRAEGDEGAIDFRQRMARQWRAFRGPILLLSSSDDYTAREFEECARTHPDWTGALARPRLTRVSLTGADHTLSFHGAYQQMLAAMLEWLPEISRAK